MTPEDQATAAAAVDVAEAFGRLHPAVQHHVVNSMRWTGLRPLQAMAVEPLLAGEDAILLAPTAGGKTEASMLPVFSRMLSEPWHGLSVLYICPIKALLNNLHDRLAGYAELFGRRAALWHGDVGEGERKRIRSDPPDVLLTTPESIEAQLVSGKTDEMLLFGDVRTVVIDEVHAFAGDDRGWHLLGVLSRLEQITGRPIQRVGLSATVGNPDDLLAWVSPPGRKGRVLDPGGSSSEIHLVLDHVGTVANAATVLAQLNRGTKRLVFCDSRTRVEDLAARLRDKGVRTFVSHSSLGIEEREDAERAFSESRDCVIVATSTLELGLDVGDLDHVIQIDAPTTVSSFLQRVGRTGRRAGSNRNGTFLATTEDEVVKCAALVQLLRSGFIEPVVPPPVPLHVLAQQLMGLILQRGGITRVDWAEHLRLFIQQAGLEEADGIAIIEHMLAEDLLAEDEGRIWFGDRGETIFGRRHFMSVMAVFTEEPLLTVRYGRREVGKIHPLSLTRPKPGEPRPPLSLAGRAWKVVDVDWARKSVLVEPDPGVGKARWLGDARPLEYAFCQACKDVLTRNDEDTAWSTRARAAVASARERMEFLEPGATSVVVELERDRATWWTFGGLRCNDPLRAACELAGLGARAENFSLTIEPTPTAEQVQQVVAAVTPTKWPELHAVITGWERGRRSGRGSGPGADGEAQRAADPALKFSEAMTQEQQMRVAAARRPDWEAVDAIRSDGLLWTRLD